MLNDFQQTVDLKKKLKNNKKQSSVKNRPSEEKEESRGVATDKNETVQADRVDEFYNKEGKNDFHVIDKASSSKQENLKIILVIVFIIFSSAAIYGLFFRDNDKNEVVVEQKKEWYAVKLVTGEVYYGEILDVSGDPVVVENVYYDYDQISESENDVQKDEASNLRLIKRGKETHGPAGTMNIIRSQVKYIEKLKKESRVLRAILDYEK